MLGFKHLVDRGYRKLAICRGGAKKKESLVDQKRYAAYRETLDLHGLPWNRHWELTTDCTVDDIANVWDQFERISDKPEAIFTGSDQVAAGLYIKAKENGYRIPEDLAILGFDNQPIAEILDLSTIEQPIAAMGVKAMRQLYEAIRQTEKTKRHLIDEIPYRLIQRSST